LSGNTERTQNIYAGNAMYGGNMKYPKYIRAVMPKDFQGCLVNQKEGDMKPKYNIGGDMKVLL